MDLNAEREIIKKELDEVDDIRLLEAIKKILDYNRSKSGTSKAYEPVNEEEYFQRILSSRKAIDEGRLITQEEAIAYFRRKNS